MVKQLTIKDNSSGMVYTLEYTRKTVQMMEQRGFNINEVDAKPMTMLPALFAGAFLAHHRLEKPNTIEKIYDSLPYKDELISKLTEMYSDTLVTLLGDPDEGENKGNLTWTADW